MNRELIVSADIAGAALDLFRGIAPRTIALAGGSTPKRFYECLAAIDYPWSSVDVFFGDERCVAPDHPDSNFAMANAALLSRVPARVHRMPGETCAAEDYVVELHSVFGPGIPVFDLVVLGLGEDGHTASLFPADPALEERERLVAPVLRPDHARLTLTLPVLSAARVALFLVSGESKRPVLASLLAGADIPAAAVHAARTVVIADPAAAGPAPK